MGVGDSFAGLNNLPFVRTEVVRITQSFQHKGATEDSRKKVRGRQIRREGSMYREKVQNNSGRMRKSEEDGRKKRGGKVASKGGMQA